MYLNFHNNSQNHHRNQYRNTLVYFYKMLKFYNKLFQSSDIFFNLKIVIINSISIAFKPYYKISEIIKLEKKKRNK